MVPPSSRTRHTDPIAPEPSREISRIPTNHFAGLKIQRRFKSLMPSILMPCWCIILALSWEAELGYFLAPLSEREQE